MKLNGLKELQKQIRSLERGSQRAINKGIQQTAKLILQSALSKVPIQMGHLKSTLGQENLPDQMIAVVYASALYAAYIEFGTGSFVEVPVGLESYAMEWFRTGNGHGRPHPYLFNSMAEHQEKLVPLIEAELIKLLKSA